MSSIIKQLYEGGVIPSCPKFIPTNLHYEVISGSVSYGVSDDSSDMDIIAVYIPPKDVVFPHLRGHIHGFGKSLGPLKPWSKHHVNFNTNEYDMTVYSIVQYFDLCADMNPNMIDTLFVPENCVIHGTAIGQKIRENRHLFLSKKGWHTFKGYAFAQLHKLKTKDPSKNPRRMEMCEKFGCDLKHGYHVVRLMLEIEQILEEGDLDIQRGREQLKAIRRGDWTLDQIVSFFDKKQSGLESLYESSKLPHTPRFDEIGNLLVECLEMHYGDLREEIVVPDRALKALNQIKDIADRELGE